MKPETNEVARLERELRDARRVIWCLAHQAGGEVQVRMTAMAKATAPGAALESWPTAEGMAFRLLAKEQGA